jgi:hypothetical protein
MDSLSKNAQTSEVSKSADGRIKIEGSTAAIRWLFGLLDGSSPKDLGIPTDETIGTPPITPLMEAMSLADKYDIPCFKNLMTDAILRLTEYGSSQALTAYSLAYNFGDETLARFYTTPSMAAEYRRSDRAQAVVESSVCLQRLERLGKRRRVDGGGLEET